MPRRTITASDREALIRLASSLPTGSEERRAILAAIKGAGDVKYGGSAINERGILDFLLNRLEHYYDSTEAETIRDMASSVGVSSAVTKDLIRLWEDLPPPSAACRPACEAHHPRGGREAQFEGGQPRQMNT